MLEFSHKGWLSLASFAVAPMAAFTRLSLTRDASKVPEGKRKLIAVMAAAASGRAFRGVSGCRAGAVDPAFLPARGGVHRCGGAGAPDGGVRRAFAGERVRVGAGGYRCGHEGVGGGAGSNAAEARAAFRVLLAADGEEWRRFDGLFDAYWFHTGKQREDKAPNPNVRVQAARQPLCQPHLETVLSYTAKAEVGGKIVQPGSRLIQGTANKPLAKFFASFAEEIRASAIS